MICSTLFQAVVDFCSSGGDYIRSKISEPMLNAMKFYKTCDPRPTHDYVPSILGASNISGILTAFQMNRTRLDSLLDATFRGDVMVSGLLSSEQTFLLLCLMNYWFAAIKGRARKLNDIFILLKG